MASPPTDEAPKPAEPEGGNIQTLRVENAISNDDRRLLALEKKVDQLERTLRSDRKRFQRMLMLLALSDDNDKDLLDKFKVQMVILPDEDLSIEDIIAKLKN